MCVSLAGQILTWEQRLVQVVIIIGISNVNKHISRPPLIIFTLLTVLRMLHIVSYSYIQ